MGDTILRVDDIQKFYGNKGNLTKAIDHISSHISSTTLVISSGRRMSKV